MPDLVSTDTLLVGAQQAQGLLRVSHDTVVTAVHRPQTSVSLAVTHNTTHDSPFRFPWLKIMVATYSNIKIFNQEQNLAKTLCASFFQLLLLKSSKYLTISLKLLRSRGKKWINN